MSVNTVLGAIETVQKVIEKFKELSHLATRHSSDPSFADLSKLTRVEPLTIVSKDLISYEPISDIQQAVLSMFTAHYLQAVNIINNISKVEVVRVLDKLNPARDNTSLLLSGVLESHNNLSLESYRYSLPRDGVTKIVLEDKSKSESVDINDLVNLSVGRLINVGIDYQVEKSIVDKNGVERTSASTSTCNIPINIRLMASTIPNRAIIGVMAHQLEDITFNERWHAWRSGRISFIKDLILAQDLIDENKRAIINDESRTLAKIQTRVANNKKAGLQSRNPSLAISSNIFVISEEVAKELEMKIGGPLSKTMIRDKIFQNTYAMLLVVVDREWNRVTFYTRGNSEWTDLSIKDIKNKAGNKGPDLLDMMKALNLGMSASF